MSFARCKFDEVEELDVLRCIHSLQVTEVQRQGKPKMPTPMHCQYFHTLQGVKVSARYCLGYVNEEAVAWAIYACP
jgi:hypothetical protein